MRKVVNVLLAVMLGFTLYCLVLAVFFVPSKENEQVSGFSFYQFKQKGALSGKIEWEICPEKFAAITKLPILNFGMVRKVRIVEHRLSGGVYDIITDYCRFEVQKVSAGDHFLSL
jgi:hypothetical protein